MDSLEALKCDWKRDAKPCTGTPRFLCGNSHILCARHAMVLTGTRRRRSTDRECLVCHNREILDFLKQAREHARRMSDGQTAELGCQ